MMLSPHFSLAELVVSQTAARRGLDNTPGPAVIAALRALCENVLEPVRVHYGRPVVVSSGYRAPLVNKAAGGASHGVPNSRQTNLITDPSLCQLSSICPSSLHKAPYLMALV